MKYTIRKIVGYSILIPIWIILTAGMIPTLIVVLLFVSILTKDWNWWRIMTYRQPHVFYYHRARLRDECEREFTIRVAAYFRARRKNSKEKVNWKRDGF